MGADNQPDQSKAQGPVPAPLPDDEEARLAELRAYDVLDTGPEEQFDRLTRLASQLSGAPIALVSLVDEARQWFKSRVGLDVAETHRDLAFCAHALASPGEVLVVEDASRDQRFAGNPLVTDDPNIRFYAGAPLVTPAGRTLGTLCVIDRQPREADPALREVLRNLAAIAISELELRRVLAETARQRDMLEAQAKRLELANRAKETFLASMSHEFRTPLNAIIGFSDLMRMEAFGPVGSDRYREYVGLVHQGGLHLLSLVEQVLDVSRLNAGAMDLRLEPVDIADKAARILRMMEATAKSAGVDLTLQVDAGTPLVLADRTALRQVLLNLVSNAVKYTPAGGKATVTARPVDGASQVELTVSDTGVGIEPEDVDRLGEPFFRAGQAHGAQSGLGLGFSITRRLVQAHGGTISVDSAPGQGTRVAVRLPAAA